MDGTQGRPLSHQRLAAAGARPVRWLVFLHGILGSASNWRTFAQRLVDAHPAWGAVLADLRMHGQSQGFAGPHTLEAAAKDVAALAQALPGPLEGVLGHSFGGKVALAAVQKLRGPLRNVFVLDSAPGPRKGAHGSEATLEALDLLESLPPTLPSREDFLRRVEARGFDRGFGQWLGMNLRKVEGGQGFALRLALPAIRELLADYFAVDLWSLVERPPGHVSRLDFILGGRSGVFDAADLARLRRASEQERRLHVEVIPGAGHWVHVDAPEETFERVSAALQAHG